MLCVGLISNTLVYDKNEVVLKSEVALMRERWLSGRHRVTRCRRPALGGLPARMRKDRARARGCEERWGGGGAAGLGREGCPLQQTPQPRGGAAAVCSAQAPPPPAEPQPRVRGGGGGAPQLSPDFVPPAPRARGQAGAKPAPVCSVLCLR